MISRVEEYVKGINRDLENVTPNEGHPYVIPSIREQVDRMARIADGNRDWYKEFFGEFLSMMEERHGITEVTHEQLMREFNVYMDHGRDAVDYFDKPEQQE